MADHIYVGSGKEKTFQDGGSILEVSLTLDGMAEYFKAYGFTASSGKKIIKLKIGRRRNVGQYGETHTVEVDTWKPDPSRAGGSAPAAAAKPAADDDIPF